MRPRVGPGVVVLREPDAGALRRQLDRGPVVVLSGNPGTVLEIAGSADRPWGLLPPDVGADALRAAVDAVAAGFTVFPPSLTAMILLPARGQRVEHRSSPPHLDALTPRELEVLQRLAEGLPNRAIADALGISDHTVKFHLASIFGKLRATTRTEAAHIGLRQGLVTI